ncbi:glycosyltransferase family 39 protein, partial [Candidatus Sumerlaeota bacterium]|nr:glycosyltransferase family 39 protein [Candidatus Sumerlaeota bacterium]
MNRQDQQSGGNPPASIEARLAKPMILYGIVAILLACFAFQCVSGMLRHSATFDEHVYIAAGYSYFQTHDFRLKKDAPPLVATLAYFAVRVLETFTHPLKFSILNKYWDLGDVFNEYKFASYFICNDNSNGYAILQSARTPIVLLGVLLGIFVFLRARALFGPLGGLAALFIYCFDPNIIAHSTIVSCDLPLACFYFIAIYYFHRAIQMPGYGNVAAFALFASLTLCSKASGLLLLPSALLLFILVFSFPASDVLAHLGGNANQYRLFLLKQAGFGIVGMALATYILLGFLYHTFSPVLMYINS